jgi:hypothetical protein
MGWKKWVNKESQKLKKPPVLRLVASQFGGADDKKTKLRYLPESAALSMVTTGY